MIYPWHQQQWRQIAEHWQNRPNAWLFTGRENTGKTEFARFTAQALLCETPKDNHEPCGTCTSCHLFAQKSHPDFYELTPEIPEGEAVGRKLLQIKIDAVRGIVDGIHLTSVRGGLRVVLVHPAEGMNLQAANSLLKVLEEPPEHVVFLLVTHARDKLLPTIKSRCRQMVLPPPSHSQALHYLRERGVAQAEALLAFHSGAPLFEHAPESDKLRAELLRLLAAPRLLVRHSTGKSSRWRCLSAGCRNGCSMSAWCNKKCRRCITPNTPRNRRIRRRGPKRRLCLPWQAV